MQTDVLQIGNVVAGGGASVAEAQALTKRVRPPSGGFSELNRSIHWIGPVRGWRLKTNATVGMVVQKTGRTTNYTTGRINATIDVQYGNRVARFKDQILTTPMSAGGDSGSLVTTLDGVAVGLLFAGGTNVTVVNHIENVRSLLRVEVAEQIL